MRLYFFSNLYISPMQHGIQGIHSLGKLMMEFALGDHPRKDEAGQVLHSYFQDHGTVIVLNGGYASTLQEIHDRLGDIAADWPANIPNMGLLMHAKFHEEEAALAGALTSVAVLVPECSYFDGRTPGRDEAKQALRLKVSEAGYTDYFEASAARNVFSPEERLALLAMSFPLAH